MRSRAEKMRRSELNTFFWKNSCVLHIPSGFIDNHRALTCILTTINNWTNWFPGLEFCNFSHSLNIKVEFDWEIRISDFAIEREIRKRTSPPRNPSLGWMSIKKSKIRISWISFLPFDWEIQKWICKTALVNNGLLFANYACACKTSVLKNSFSNPKTDISALKSIFRFHVWLQIRNPDFII